MKFRLAAGFLAATVFPATAIETSDYQAAEKDGKFKVPATTPPSN